MSTIEQEVLSHLQNAWGTRTRIAWNAANLSFDPHPVTGGYSDLSSFLVPACVPVKRRVLEWPYASGVEEAHYLLSVLIVTALNTGTAQAEAYREALALLYHRQTLQTANFRLEFSTMQEKPGRLDPLEGASYWNLPVSFPFRVYL